MSPVDIRDNIERLEAAKERIIESMVFVADDADDCTPAAAMRALIEIRMVLHSLRDELQGHDGPDGSDDIRGMVAATQGRTVEQ